MRFMQSIEAVILQEAVGDLPEEHTPLIAYLRDGLELCNPLTTVNVGNTISSPEV